MPWSSWLLLPSSVVLSTGKVSSLSGPATATGGLLFSVKIIFSVWHFLGSHWQGLPIRGKILHRIIMLQISYIGLKVQITIITCTSQQKPETPVLQQAKSHKYFTLSQSYLKAQSYSQHFAACSMHCMKCFIIRVVGYSPGSTTASLSKPPTRVWFFAVEEDTVPGFLLLKVSTTPLS